MNKNEGVKEYDYYIQTNNLGLVMKNNVYQRETIHLFIGNSFTEGQEQTPGFTDLRIIGRMFMKNLLTAEY